MWFEDDLTLREDRSALGPLMEAQEGHLISITLSDHSELTLCQGWALLDRPEDADGSTVRISSAGIDYCLEMDEVVRINDEKSGEMIWETQRGQYVWEPHPPKKIIQFAAFASFALFVGAILNLVLGWNRFGEWGTFVLIATFYGVFFVISRAPKVAEVN